MKSILTLSIILSVLFFSCSKSSSNGGGTASGTLEADVDGTHMVFSKFATATREHVGTLYSISFAGFQGAAGSSNEMTFAVGGTDSVIAGTYLGNYANPQLDMSSIFYYDGGITNYATTGTSPDTCIVKITSMDQNNVQGTFSGNVLLNSGAGGATAHHTITNGTFNLKFAN